MSPSQMVNGLLSTLAACRRQRSPRPAPDEIEVELLGQLSSVWYGRRGDQPPDVIGGVGGAGQAADVGFAVAYDRVELGGVEGVPAEFAARRLVETVQG